MKPSDEQIAYIVHEAHRAYQAAVDPLRTTHVMPAPPWVTMTKWQKETVIGLVKLVRGDLQQGLDVLYDPPGVYGPASLTDEILAARAHALWVQRMEGKGWTWGGDKDPQKKTHPNLVSWDLLPEEERAKTLQAVAIARVHI